MNILVFGATGHMGQILCDQIEQSEDMTVCARVGHCARIEYDGPVDCVIDFSHHDATGMLLEFCTARACPVVIATTGQTDGERAGIQAAARTIPVFFAANMSVGIALLAELAERAARMFPGADIEILERHHNRKLDVPSGTALMLANRVAAVREGSELLVGRHENGRRRVQEIGIHSLRYGNEVGTHEIILSDGRETITLRHEAENRSLFAGGALAAARFLVGRPAGLYTMQSMLSGGNA